MRDSENSANLEHCQKFSYAGGGEGVLENSDVRKPESSPKFFTCKVGGLTQKNLAKSEDLRIFHTQARGALGKLEMQVSHPTRNRDETMSPQSRGFFFMTSVAKLSKSFDPGVGVGVGPGWGWGHRNGKRNT